MRTVSPVPCLWLALVLATPALVGAQSLTGVTALPNAGNAADEVTGPGVNPSYERQSAVAVTAATATTFTTRYKALITVDPGLFGDARTETLSSDYTIAFTVTAPGAYRVQVVQQRKGDLHLVEDNIFASGHWADMTALTGTATGGTVSGGSLNLADPGRADDIPLVFDPISTPFDQGASATVFGISNGGAQPHTLRFTWSQAAYSPPSGDEAAVRMGGTSHDPTETAGDYPGSPARVQADDGHFVTVTLISLCGNGGLDSGPDYAEECDDGALNGTAQSCCTSDCHLKAAGIVCRDAAGGCDHVEVCDGERGFCPMDSVMPAFVTCRPAAGPCDVAEVCDGVTAYCPGDDKSTALCRPAAGACDLPESCDGVNDACPTDRKSTAVCRPAVGQCDVAETCDGFNPSCPADQTKPNGTTCDDGSACTVGETCTAGVCGGGSGGCGPCETCDAGACLAQARPSCTQPTAAGAAQLLIKSTTPDAGDQISWKWSRGPAATLADFGNPLDTTDYALCVFDQGGSHLVAAPTLPAGGVCGTRACWRQLGTRGFKYKDPDRTPTGADKALLQPGAVGKTRLSVKAKGPHLALPALGLSGTVRVQLQGENGACFESVHSTPAINTPTQYKGRSD